MTLSLGRQIEVRCTWCDVRYSKIVGRDNDNLPFTPLMLIRVQRRPKFSEVPDHEEQGQKPECEPNRCDEMKPNQKQNQTGREEHCGVTQKPEAIRSAG